MKNISDVYNSLKKEYPKMDITLSDDVITIIIFFIIQLVINYIKIKKS